MSRALLASVMLLAVVVVVPSPAEAHCTLPTSAECVQDWVDAVFDKRWINLVCIIVTGKHCVESTFLA